MSYGVNHHIFTPLFDGLNSGTRQGYTYTDVF